MRVTEPVAPSRSQFPQDFVWGVATSSFQIEGAAQVDGRGPSIWDTFCKQPGAIADGSDGAVACDHYHRWHDDTDLLTQIGFNAYRFSISWSRVQPLGHGPWNEAGFEFYDRLLTKLQKMGVQAHVTLNHWDLPQPLQDQGGWGARDTCGHFVRYAREVARRFGDRITSLCTHNEPWVIAVLGHQTGVFAPGLKSRALAMQVAHHLLLSHGMALRALREDGVPSSLGIVLNLSPIYPATDSADDQSKAKLEDGLNTRWYTDALLLGRYPRDIAEHLGEDAPRVIAGDMELIAQPLDFLGVNYYTRNFASSGNPWDAHSTGNVVTEMGWEVYPQGLTELLCRLHRDYALPRVLITENGAAFKDDLDGGEVDDADRERYFQSHIRATLDARNQGVPVDGYFAWSLLDNFEWACGYQKRFGIVHVDYQTQARTLKRSGKWLRHFLNGQ